MHKLPHDILYARTLIANVVFVGNPDTDDWVLVDAGVRMFADTIAETAKKRFRSGKPRAIVLTHGHFDHVGSLQDLLELWDVPVYAHEKELPYVTGAADYPEPDPTVGGGLMARISPLYPHKGINLGNRVQALPVDGTVPHMAGWRWIHTPGHTDGHVSFFRESDRMLIAGDAFITVKQESALAVITQKEEIHGPPTYFTVKWYEAWASVKRLEALDPLVAVTGHGVPMYGVELIEGLRILAQDFDRLAIPEHGKYIDR
ncbi:MBL fold metallo-hydrolase [Paenibacillus hemerocallicola]|uniref:MBL fold metallo-hydrolase n=1 Tax=Paenibacillus hemerocallicola TaxID=1172614 RepID=A0A5C4T4C4_9BACL|nr:MBL fold metallo-hydrolase [Paenibacillus hemerocallicola]TNJ63873.1 MBL fold metallo-hydrolase [Paenibacillus hemerocallicola]